MVNTAILEGEMTQTETRYAPFCMK